MVWPTTVMLFVSTSPSASPSEVQRDVGAVDDLLVVVRVVGDAGAGADQFGLRVVHAEDVRLIAGVPAYRVGLCLVARAVRGHHLVEVGAVAPVRAAGGEGVGDARPVGRRLPRAGRADVVPSIVPCAGVPVRDVDVDVGGLAVGRDRRAGVLESGSPSRCWSSSGLISS